MTRPARIVWPCQVCHRPIADGTGYLCADASAAIAGVHIRWHIVHGRCDPEPDDGSTYWYTIDVDRIRTPWQVIEWTAHLAGKSWYPLTDWHRVLDRLVHHNGAPRKGEQQ